MTLGLSIGNSLGIGNNVLPDYSEITRLWTPGDRINTVWYDASTSLISSINGVVEFQEKEGGPALTGLGQETSRNSLQVLNIPDASTFSGTIPIKAINQTWFVAFRPRTHDSSSDQVFSYSESNSPSLKLKAGGTTFFGRFEKLNGVPGQDVYPGFLTESTGTGITDWAIASIRLDFDNSTLQDRYNGCPVDGDHVDYKTITEDAILTLGSTMDVDIGDLLVIPSVDELEVQTVEGYLAHKWAIALCAGNPFASGPPTVTTVGPNKYLTDEDGNYITDDNGNQVLVQGM